MIIDWQELPGDKLTVNETGLDDLTRRFQGDADLWDLFKPQILLGGADTEFPNMYVIGFEREGNEGDLQTAVATFKGIHDGSDGTSKPPKVSNGTSPQSGTASGVAYLRYDYTDGLDINPEYQTAVIGVPGELTFDAQVPTVTFRYTRNYRVLDHEYETEATAILLAQEVEVDNKRFKSASGKLPAIVSGATNIEWTYPTVGGAGYTKIKKAGLDCQPVGLCFEVVETWEIAVFTSEEGTEV